MNFAIPAAPSSLAERLNQRCACKVLDEEKLRRELASTKAAVGMAENVAIDQAGLFSSTMVFVNAEQAARMREIVRAVEHVVATPAWRRRALANAAAIAQVDHGPAGVFFGYDFHLCAQGPQLIEINTNAGGAMLNAVLANAQRACCKDVEPALDALPSISDFTATWLAMFVAEWQRQRGDKILGRIAIVDHAPAQQFLYPEFRLFQQMFADAGYACVIADPTELVFVDGQLRCADGVVDLVYNRLTDFYLEESSSAALREAYSAGAVVLTPNPFLHAVYADKRHLAMFSCPQKLQELGVSEADFRGLSAGVPQTILVNADNAATLWLERKHWFFKPMHGYASKAAYRGDKLTKRVWQMILAEKYVAQRIASASQRLVLTPDGMSELKFDVRAYVYAGDVQLFAARLYAGQTTNFRTPGGGFAPVFEIV
jgi:hypothetical protein